MFVSREDKVPSRPVSGSEASVVFMTRSVGTWTIAPIWLSLSGDQFAQDMSPFEAKEPFSQGDAVSPTLGT